ncbi:MAG: DUF2786 domain-containing protein [Desulforhopalus sp.]|nr:DUF2786 domain-containing protein [Desulforhopalus sp.]
MAVHFRIDRLQGLWLEQLYREHRDICWEYGVPLPTPIFEITDSEKIYGRWQAPTGILGISRHLILQHPWHVTLQVLRHEMAHQLCSTLVNGGGPVHGAAFQEACERLGVLPEFRHPGVVIPETVRAAAAPSELSEEGRRCLAKIAKLLALGRSANEHEAAAAMAKANELLQRYHLQGTGDHLNHRYARLVINRKKKKIAGFQRHICAILQEFFHVRVVLAQLYEPSSGESFRVIELFGTRENAAIAEYCYHFLENRLALLWSANRGRFRGAAQTEKTSYYLGLLRGFHQKLAEQKRGREMQNHRQEAGALVLAEEQRLAGFIGMYFPRLRRAPSRSAKVYGTTYDAGMEAGRQLDLHQGVTGQAPVFGGLLE